MYRITTLLRIIGSAFERRFVSINIMTSLLRSLTTVGCLIMVGTSRFLGWQRPETATVGQGSLWIRFFVKCQGVLPTAAVPSERGYRWLAYRQFTLATRATRLLYG